MPFIFPKRFLRTKDILDPHELNQDTEPVQELLDGELDRHNFSATSLKDNIASHPSRVTSADFNACVGENAYYKSYSAEVEVPIITEQNALDIDTDGSTPLTVRNQTRHPPNFVGLDGSTFRYPLTSGDASAFTSAYPTYESLPSVIPNSGDWAAVQNSELSDAMKVDLTTGKSSLYINALVQYVWQGFYEYKPPWKYQGPPDFSSTDTTAWGYASVFTNKLVEEERRILNEYGPTNNWIYWANELNSNAFIGSWSGGVDDLGHLLDLGIASTVLTPHNNDPHYLPLQTPYPYSFALNEPSAESELHDPQGAGYHHISKGFYPALVQFAIRLDGKIIEETITGKTFSFDESAHGLRVEDSPLFKVGKGDDATSYVFGQRSAGVEMSYDKGRSGRPGQKIRSARATACGPEVLPVRIGAVVPVSPGAHTVEIVARRLIRKRKQFEVGDFVGVFTRRLHVMDVPIFAPDFSSENEVPPATIRSYQTEDNITVASETIKLDTLANRINDLRSTDIKSRSLPNTHLPSKVGYWETKSISPEVKRTVDGTWESTCSVLSRFPGFRNKAFIDRRTSGSWYGGYDGFESSAWMGAGWKKITDDAVGASDLGIAPTGSTFHLSGDEELLIFGDIEVLSFVNLQNIHLHTLSAAARDSSSSVSSQIWANFLCWIQHHRYLDLFGLFNIGYRTGSDELSNWVIGSKHAPVMLNSFNWVNRRKSFLPYHGNIGDMILIDANTGEAEGIDYSLEPGISYPIDLRGTATAQSNLGVNIPLFLRLTRDDFASDALAEITEIALFGSTTFPSDWDANAQRPSGHVFRPPEYGSREAGGGATVYKPETHEAGEDPDYFGGTFDLLNTNTWMSPVFGRGILDGLGMYIGRCRLTVIKLYK